MRRESAGGSEIANTEDRGRSGLGSVVDVLEEGRGTAGSDFGIGEKRFLGGWEAGVGDGSRGLVESFGVGVTWGRRATAEERNGDVAEGRWRLEELTAGEFRDLTARVRDRSAGCESASRDSCRIGESSSVERALDCSASQGKLVGAAGHLAFGGGRPERSVGDNVRHIKMCIRPRSLSVGEQEEFASYASSARSSLRSELVVVDRGDRDRVQTTGCPRTRSRTTHPRSRPEICSRKKVAERVLEKATKQDQVKEAEVGRQRGELRRIRERRRIRRIRCGQGGRGSRGGWRRRSWWSRCGV